MFLTPHKRRLPVTAATWPARRAIVCALALALLPPSFSAGYPGEGILIGDTLIRPYADGSVAFDSNVLLTSSNVEDTVLNGLAGITINSSGKSGSAVGLHVWVLSKKYREYEELTATDIGESLSLTADLADMAKFTISQNYSKSTEDKNFLADFVGDMKHFSGSMGYAFPVGKRLIADVGFFAKSGVYDQEQLYDWDEQGGMLRLLYKATEDTSAILDTSATRMSSSGQTNATMSYAARAGARTQVTDKTDVEGTLGVVSVDDESGSLSPSLQGAAHWQASDNSRFVLDATTQVYPAPQYAENYVVANRCLLGITVEASETVSLSADATLQYNTYTEDIVVDEVYRHLTETVVAGGAMIVYAVPLRFLNLYARVETQEKTTSIDEGGYDRRRLILGLRLQY